MLGNKVQAAGKASLGLSKPRGVTPGREGSWSRGNLRERRWEVGGKEECDSWGAGGIAAPRKQERALSLASAFCLFAPLQRVNSDTVLQFLRSLKYSYTKQELLESELAVLETLCYQINVSTPLAYVELLLEVLGERIHRGGWERFCFKSAVALLLI